MKKEYHIGIVTRNVEKATGITDDATTSQVSAKALRGAVYFAADALFDGEYPEPAEPSFGYASNNGAGFFWVPRVGDSLLIEIDVSLDNPRPRYVSSWYNNDNDINPEFAINYPRRLGWATNSGHILVFDDTENEELIMLAHMTNTRFEWDYSGDWYEEIVRDKVAKIRSNFNRVIQKDSNEEIIADRYLNVRTNEYIDITGSSHKKTGNDSSLEVDGDYDFKAKGVTEELGGLEQNIKGGKIVTTDSGYKEVIGGSKAVNIVSNKGETIAGTDAKMVAMESEATYGLGRKETVALGDHAVEVQVGNIDHQTLAGTVNLANLLASFGIDIAGAINIASVLSSLSLDVAGGANLAGLLGGFETNPAGISTVSGTMVVLGAQVGMVLTTITAPVVDNITGVPHIGVPTVWAG